MNFCFFETCILKNTQTVKKNRKKEYGQMFLESEIKN